MCDLCEQRFEQWSLRPVETLRQSATLSVYKVTGGFGGFAALKIYHPGHAGNESGAAPYLQAMSGRAVAPVLAVERGALLTGWLEGPALSDLADTALPVADKALARLARDLLKGPTPPIKLPSLSEWLCDAQDRLSRLAPSDRHMELSKVLSRGQSALGHVSLQPLHGDLHHGNVILTASGATAFDAKGVLGPKSYELANALRHPVSSAPVAGPELAERISVFANVSGLAPAEIAFWAAVKSALSIIWRGELSSPVSSRDFQRMRACLALPLSKGPRN